MTTDRIHKILTKLFNSPLITNKFPNIDKVVITDVIGREGLDSYILKLDIYLKEPLIRHRIFFLEDIYPFMKDLMNSAGIGTDYNRIRYNVIGE